MKGPINRMKYVTSTIVRANDIALNNNLFGGTLMRWCDEYGGLFAYKYLHHTFVTYKMGTTYFLKPGKLGDLIDFYVDNLKFNKISVTFDLIAQVNNESKKRLLNTSVTFVAIDINTEKAVHLNPFLFEKHEFEAFVTQRIKLPENVEHPQVNISGKGMDLKTYKRNYIKELYLNASNQDVAQAITMFQKDYIKIIPPETISEVITAMNDATKTS